MAVCDYYLVVRASRLEAFGTGPLLGVQVKREPKNQIQHIRVTKLMRDQIAARATGEDRTVTDMVRVLLAYALSEMPNYRLPTNNFGVTPKASNTDVPVE